MRQTSRFCNWLYLQSPTRGVAEQGLGKAAKATQINALIKISYTIFSAIAAARNIPTRFFHFTWPFKSFSLRRDGVIAPYLAARRDASPHHSASLHDLPMAGLVRAYTADKIWVLQRTPVTVFNHGTHRRLLRGTPKAAQKRPSATLCHSSIAAFSVAEGVSEYSVVKISTKKSQRLESTILGYTMP